MPREPIVDILKSADIRHQFNAEAEAVTRILYELDKYCRRLDSSMTIEVRIAHSDFIQSPTLADELRIYVASDCAASPSDIIFSEPQPTSRPGYTAFSIILPHKARERYLNLRERRGDVVRAHRHSVMQSPTTYHTPMWLLNLALSWQAFVTPIHHLMQLLRRNNIDTPPPIAGYPIGKREETFNSAFYKARSFKRKEHPPDAREDSTFRNG